MVADGVTMRSADNPVLVVALGDERGREFRAAPTPVHSIENNLSIANMDFHEFADAVGDDGVFRGFRPEPHTTPRRDQRRARTAERNLHHVDAGVGEDGVEGGGELAGPVPDQIPDWCAGSWGWSAQLDLAR